MGETSGAVKYEMPNTNGLFCGFARSPCVVSVRKTASVCVCAGNYFYYALDLLQVILGH